MGRLLVLLVSLNLHWASCQAAGCGLLRVHISLLCSSAMIIPLDSLLPSHSWSVAHPKDACTLPSLKNGELNSISLPYGSSFSITPPVPCPPFLNYWLFQFSLSHLPPMTVLFPLLSEIQPCSFQPSFLFLKIFLYMSTLQLYSDTPEEGVRSHYGWL